MDSESRTDKSIKNIIVALVLMGVNMLLQFKTRNVFLERLGTEVLGLNTTATNLLQFLNIAELGIGVAVGFALYKPLFDRDEKRICEIVALQGHLYSRIAMFVTAGAIVLGCFFPLIFSKMKLPLWYAYASFGVLLVSTLLTYFVNYKEVLLTADQKEYKVAYSYRACMMLRLAVQMVVVSYVDNPYIWWLILEGGFAVIASVALHLMVRRTYPFLRRPEASGKELRRRYPDIVSRIKQVFFHKISTFVLQQSSPLVIYGFASLTLVTFYTNYTTIVVAVLILLNALFNSIGASVGNLVAEGDRERILRIFDELYAIRIYICAGAAIMVFMLSQPFIGLWIGKEYLLPESTLLIISVTLFLNTARHSVDAYINAYGLFRDVWAPIAEAVLNLGLSVLFGFFWGLNGILCGVIVSLLLIVYIWKPYFLFSAGLHAPISIYLRIHLCNIAAICAALFPIYWCSSMLDFGVEGWSGFALLAAETFAIVAFFLFVAQFALTSGMRMFTRRMVAKIRRAG
ncbi:MAG: sugar transporter [Muribaculaceae bacterium]|nr:sugar transporter [Muribaculaceae bacterium]